MANPITWRNINAPSNNAGVALLRDAGRSVNAGLGRIGATLDDRIQLQEDNRQEAIDKNTQAFRDQLAGYRSPEELQSAIAGGEISALRERYGDLIDSNAIRGAEDARVATLQNQVTTQRNFDDSTARRENKDLHVELDQQAYDGDLEGAIKRVQESSIVDKAGTISRLQQRDSQFRDETINNVVSDVVAHAGSQQEARNLVESSLVNDYGLNSAEVNKALQILPTAYGARNNLTEEQQREITQQTAISNQRLDTDVAKVDTEIGVLEQSLDNVVNYLQVDEQPISEGDVLQDIANTLKIGETEWVDDDDVDVDRSALPAAVADVTNQVQTHLNSMKGGDALDAGRIVQELFKRIVTDDLDDEGRGEINVTVVKGHIPDLVKEIADSLTKQGDALGQISEKRSYRRKLEDSRLREAQRIETDIRNRARLKRGLKPLSYAEDAFPKKDK